MQVTGDAKPLTTFAGLIYMVGGCTHDIRHRQDVMCYNPVTREWTSLAPMLTPRSQMGISILDGYLYVIGGTNKNGLFLTSVERYSFEKVISNVFSLLNILYFVVSYVPEQMEQRGAHAPG